MKALIAIGLAAAVSIAGASAADARQGCGRGFHRNFHGRCVPNGRQQAYVVGRYYPGHGYWYHNTWYHHRRMRHGVWIYL